MEWRPWLAGCQAPISTEPGTQVLPARAEGVPRCPKPALCPALCHGPCSGSAYPTGRGSTRGPGRVRARPQTLGSRSALLPRRQTPPAPPQASKRVTWNFLGPQLAPRSCPARPVTLPRLPHLPQRRPVPLLLEALAPIFGEVGAEFPEAVELLALPRRALPRVQHAAVQRQRAAPEKRAEHGPGRRRPSHGFRAPAAGPGLGAAWGAGRPGGAGRPRRLPRDFGSRLCGARRRRARLAAAEGSPG